MKTSDRLQDSVRLEWESSVLMTNSSSLLPLTLLSFLCLAAPVLYTVLVTLQCYPAHGGCSLNAIHVN